MIVRKPTYFASIEWMAAAEGGRKAPPTGEGPDYMTTARFGAWTGNMPGEANFTLVAELVEKADAYHWRAKVAFLVDEAPHHLLQPGAKFEFYEGRRCVARGIIEEAAD